MGERFFSDRQMFFLCMYMYEYLCTVQIYIHVIMFFFF